MEKERKMRNPKSDPHVRSIMKSISWRIFAVLVTTFTTWLITGESRLAATVGIADSALKVFLYYAHERAWTRLKFGNAEFE